MSTQLGKIMLYLTDMIADISISEKIVSDLKF
jgi:hypothetical protein